MSTNDTEILNPEPVVLTVLCTAALLHSSLATAAVDGIPYQKVGDPNIEPYIIRSKF